ncbi:hypothetical protein H0H81_002918 [Sphagnurus paluster]|uniref:Uncharacterized protein n=1 Tax=Sphagnurus paluster TaxID=117069 RepID=A0A9P7GJD5_9AGAR|nr:hypothetical protein H0H81_002918 [Sphagnurus paluster]
MLIRGAHIIPAFHHGPTGRFPPSLAQAEDKFDDWLYYYVNMYVHSSLCQKSSLNLLNLNSFVDRDMYMRYAGGGVGHYRMKLPEEPTDMVENEVDIQIEPPAVSEKASPDSDSESEPGSDSDSEDSDDDGLEDGHGEDLGPEDGEGGVYDAEDENGYAPL